MPSLSYVPVDEVARLRALKLPVTERVALVATVARLNALYMIARAGSGHIGSSFSSLDLITWLHLEEMGPDDVFFSSKGHDAPGYYALLLALGRLDPELIHGLRRLGGLPGHPDVGTPGVAANTGSLGMGISKAKGMVRADRLAGRSRHYFVMTGDGELQEGQIWESLGSAAAGSMGELTVVVDHNKIQSDTWVARVSDLGDLVKKFQAFGWRAVRCDGHDLAKLRRTFAALAKVTDRPKVLVADTIKGRGVSFMESGAMTPADQFYRFHSGAPDDSAYDRAVAELLASANATLAAIGSPPLATVTVARPERAVPAQPERLVPAYSRALLTHAERDPRIVALDADLVLDTGLIPFAARFPDRFIECGIAEQDMVSQAGGLALAGMLPVVHSFACFLSTRPNEQIYTNATERRKIVYVGSLAGLLPGGPGHSHQSVRDISALAAIPGLELLQPASESEVAQAVAYALEDTETSCYLRLVSIPCRVPYRLPEGYQLQRGRGIALTDGGDAVLFGYGPVMLAEAFDAASLLRERHGFGLRVVNLPWLNLVDDAWLVREIGDVRHVVTLDDHYVHGGQGELLAARIAELGVGVGPVHRFGIRSIPACGQNDEVLRAHRLDAESLAADILAAVQGRAD
ncbi:MAG TPA: transketolase C-terminal domain-containing protein [Gemmatimonadales bacterium]|nr:transketolase C-terminal domain-containing protein [Gemmatimonadales bacterium]